MTRFVLGVVGHVDHGKTALVRALTGIDTDRLTEEKRRGISIALGFAHLRLGPDSEVDLIDMPGHERFVRTMVAGATGIDAVLLVVAANEGIKPQTIEHVDIAALLGLRRAVVAVTKTDLVESDEARRVAGEAAELLVRAGFDPPRRAMTSAIREEGIEELRGALHSLVAEQCPRPADGLAFLPIDRAFTMAGHGPVVTGTLRGTTISAGDRLELCPLRRMVRVRAVQVHGERVATALPGQRVALNLRDVESGELGRGMALAAPGTLSPGDWLTMSIRAVDGAPPLKNGMRLRALFGTEEADVRLRLLDRDELAAGEAGFAQLRCAEPVMLPAGEHAILRIASPARTVAGGKLLEAGILRHRRHRSEVLQRLRQLDGLPAAELIAAEVEREGSAGTTLQHLSRLTALAEPRVMELLQGLPVLATQSGLVLPKAQVNRLLAQIPALLALHSEGLPYDRLLAALPGIGTALLDETLSRLLAGGAIAKRGSQYLIPRPEVDRARSRDEAELAAQIAETLRQGGLMPPRPAEIVTDAASRRAVDRLLREGTIVRAVDRAKGKEILFHQDAIEEARQHLAPLLDAGPGLLVTEIGGVLGISRKYTMPLLDHLDGIRFTRRINDRRLLCATVPLGR